MKYIMNHGISLPITHQTQDKLMKLSENYQMSILIKNLTVYYKTHQSTIFIYSIHKKKHPNQPILEKLGFLFTLC